VWDWTFNTAMNMWAGDKFASLLFAFGSYAFHQRICQSIFKASNISFVFRMQEIQNSLQLVVSRM
jgi:hypothetical protein